jgi:hypothetical protein
MLLFRAHTQSGMESWRRGSRKQEAAYPTRARETGNKPLHGAQRRETPGPRCGWRVPPMPHHPAAPARAREIKGGPLNLRPHLHQNVYAKLERGHGVTSAALDTDQQELLSWAAAPGFLSSAQCGSGLCPPLTTYSIDGAPVSFSWTTSSHGVPGRPVRCGGMLVGPGGYFFGRGAPGMRGGTARTARTASSSRQSSSPLQRSGRRRLRYGGQTFPCP